MFIKDKNVNAANERLAKEKESKLKDLTIEEIAAIAIQCEATEKQLRAHAALVKKHVNEVYAPMCAKKRDLEIELAYLNAKLTKIKQLNPALAAVAKLCGN